MRSDLGTAECEPNNLGILQRGTRRIRQRFELSIDYPVIFTWGAFEHDNTALLQALTEKEPGRIHRVLVVVDEGLERAWPELRAWVGAYFDRHRARLELVGEPVTVIGGEGAKNDPAIIQHLQQEFRSRRMDRHSFVLVIGGGAVQDAVGYAAATTHRGLRTVRMPTTVLSQDDSGVGVKNGVNAFGAKNFFGTFVAPFAVVCDFSFLERLPRRDFVAGMAEAVKVALVRDPSFFDWIESNAAELAALKLEVTAELIQRAAELHLLHIATSGDPFETGSARPLDYGHWAAHKLETLTAHDLRHGEAVAIGLVLDSRYSAQAGLLGETDFERIYRLVAQLGLPVWHEALTLLDSAGRPLVLGGLDEFREHLGGELTVSLLRGIGRRVDVHAISPDGITAAISWMRERAGAR
jgi:3-dehydroquinate synthase